MMMTALAERANRSGTPTCKRQAFSCRSFRRVCISNWLFSAEDSVTKSMGKTLSLLNLYVCVYVCSREKNVACIDLSTAVVARLE